MSALTDYAEKLVLDWLMTSDSVTRPSSWYIGLFTGATSEDGTGPEVSGFGYARQPVSFNPATSGSGLTKNNNVIQYYCVGGDWGTITNIGIFDSATGGNMIWHGTLTATKTITDGDLLQFPVNAIELTVA